MNDRIAELKAEAKKHRDIFTPVEDQDAAERWAYVRLLEQEIIKLQSSKE